MKISGKELKNIISEEVSKYLKENDGGDQPQGEKPQEKGDTPESIKKKVEAVASKIEAAPGLDSALAQMGNTKDGLYGLLKYMINKADKVTAQNKALAIRQLYQATKDLTEL